jgi:acetyl-CoA C-acetyltransferase/acetyl-CoA acyltransferase
MGMGQTAELVAREHNISRKRQDDYAELSHNKALATTDCRELEIAPYHLTNDDCLRSPSGKVVTRDNGPRNDSDARKLSRLRTIFDREGTVTAGNASQVTDGGVALLLMTKPGLKRTGATPIAKIVDYEYAGCDPKRMGLGPIHAIKKLGRKASIDNMDLIEINEAFAAQVLVCIDELDIPIAKLNSLGGAISLGHPLAATGARLVLSLAKSLQRRNLTNGLASLCVGGGQGGAIWVQRS